MKNILTALLLSITILSFGQTTMNIYQSNGTTINLPISTIDSVNFTTTPPPSRMNIYQTGGGVISIVIANIDSITYTVQGASGLAVLSTMPVTNIDSTSAVSGGNVASDGGSPITQRGVVWSTTPNPTTANNNTIDGSGTGSFLSTLTGLTANTTYYVRAYATNANGTAYGNEVSFTTTAAGGGSGTYPPGTVHCTGTPTAVVDVTNPTTGKIWMDRNLGASQAAQPGSFGVDPNSFGDLYQWGRGADGHQCHTSPTTVGNFPPTLSSTDQPGHGDFITNGYISYFDWRNPQNNNLWQGVNGVNNPCPSGYRLPTNAELDAERASWSQQGSDGALASPLKLPKAGYRIYSDGSLSLLGSLGNYWSSTVNGANADYLYFNGGNAYINDYYRAYGFSVRCIKETSGTLGSLGSLNCGGAVNTGTLTESQTASGVSSSVPYTGGNGGTHSGQIVSSTGVTGLTATLAAGTFVVGSGNLTYTISGTPDSAGTASFALNIGGQSCTLTINVDVDLFQVQNNTNATQLAESLAGAGVTIFNAVLNCDQSGTGTFQNAPNQLGIEDGIILSSGTAINAVGPSAGNNSGVHGTTGEPDLEALLLSLGETYPVNDACVLEFDIDVLGDSLTFNYVMGSEEYNDYVCGTVNDIFGFFVTGPNPAGPAYASQNVAILPGSTTPVSINTVNNGAVGAYGGGAATCNLTNAAFFNGIVPGISFGGNTVALEAKILTVPCTTYSIKLAIADGGDDVFDSGVFLEAGSFTSLPVSQCPSGSVFCASGPTAVVDVTNPSTGKVWMDRNLGASQVATSSTDTAAYGDLYQWGRGADGHQCRTSPTTATLSSTDQPGHGDFIIITNNAGNYDWRNPQNNNLWQGVNGVNNPCPSGYRLPTRAELDAERASWSSNNASGAFASPLKLLMAGNRSFSNGSLGNFVTGGYYWSSTVVGTNAYGLNLYSSNAYMNNTPRAYGVSVRCLKD